MVIFHSYVSLPEGMDVHPTKNEQKAGLGSPFLGGMAPMERKL